MKGEKSSIEEERMPLKMIISSNEGVIGTIDNWEGPVPRPGDYIFHPMLDNREVLGRGDGGNVISVQTVTWGILARPRVRTGQFTGRTEEYGGPYVEVFV